MAKLNFVSLQSDGTHLVLQDETGKTYHLPITPELRAALRRPSPIAQQHEPAGKPTLRPRDIQAMLRAGTSVADVAASGNLSEDAVRRYEGPIVAERRWAIEQARECTVGHELGAPNLGDLVLDRLAERGVDTSNLSWHAYREATEPWNVTVEFEAGGKTRRARWRLDLQNKAVRAMEDEARWLSETDSASPRAKRHMRGYAEPATPDEEPDAETPEDPGQQTESLLDQLARHRGRRPEPAPFGETDYYDPLFGASEDVPAAHPSRPEEATDAVVLSFPDREPEISEPSPEELEIPVEKKPKDQPKRSKSKSGRRSVPSWDEIVFGGKSED